MTLHIYRSPGQSLIKEQRCPWIARGIKFPAYKPNELVWARCCGERHPAKNLYVQHYYDGASIWCLPGKGCKSKAQAKRAAKRRSIAARAGWQTRRRMAKLSATRGNDQ